MMNQIKKDTLVTGIRLKMSLGKNLEDILKEYTALSDEEKKELKEYFKKNKITCIKENR